MYDLMRIRFVHIPRAAGEETPALAERAYAVIAHTGRTLGYVAKLAEPREVVSVGLTVRWRAWFCAPRGSLVWLEFPTRRAAVEFIAQEVS